MRGIVGPRSRAPRVMESSPASTLVVEADLLLQYVMLDATLVRAHQQAATGKGAAKKAVRTRLWVVPEAD